MASTRDDLPPALSSMWRLCKLGYRHEPGLLLAAFLLALLAALPDAMVAVWIALFGDGGVTRQSRPNANGGNRPRSLGHRNLAVANGRHARTAALP